jgi:hypothetical protein
MVAAVAITRGLHPREQESRPFAVIKAIVSPYDHGGAELILT